MAQNEIHKRVGELEKSHSKVLDLKEELRIISTEYADIRSRLEATDVLVDHVIRQLEVEATMRKITILMVTIIILLVITVVLNLP